MCYNGYDKPSVIVIVVLAVSNRKYVHKHCLVLVIGGVVCIHATCFEVVFYLTLIALFQSDIFTLKAGSTAADLAVCFNSWWMYCKIIRCHNLS